MAPKLNGIGLIAADMGKTLAFYRRLGLDIPTDADDQPHAEVTLPGGVRIMWDTFDTIRSFDPDWSPPEGAGRMSLAFECDDPAEVDRVYAELVGAGHTSYKEPWDAFWGQRYAVVHDPDDNTVDLYAPL